MLHVVFIICIRAMMYWKYVSLYFFRLGVHLLIGVKAIDGRENLPTVLWSTMVSEFILHVFSVRSIYYEMFTSFQTISH